MANASLVILSHSARFKGKGKLEADNVFFDAAQKKETRMHRRDCVVFNLEKLIKDSALLLFAVRNMRLGML